MVDVGIRDVDYPGKKRVKRDSSIKKNRLYCIIENRLGAWAVNHVLEPTDVPESGVYQRTDGGHEDNSHMIDFAKFVEKCVDFECLQY